MVFLSFSREFSRYHLKWVCGRVFPDAFQVRMPLMAVPFGSMESEKGYALPAVTLRNSALRLRICLCVCWVLIIRLFLQPEWTVRFLLWWRVCFLWVGNLIFVYIIQMNANLQRDNAFSIWDFLLCLQYKIKMNSNAAEYSCLLIKINCFVLSIRSHVGLDYCWFWFWLSVVGRTRN